MTGPKPYRQRLKRIFATAAASLMLAGGMALENLSKNPATDTQNITTFQEHTANPYGYNIAPSSQFWKQTLPLQSYGALQDDLAEAAQTGDSWRTRALLEHAPYMAYQTAGHTALETAAAAGHGDVIKALLENDVSPRAQESAALITAIDHQQMHIVHQLLDAGADAGARQSHGLYLAVSQDRDILVDILLAHGARATDNESLALRQAASMGNTAMARKLITAGANVADAESEALSRAAAAGHLDMVALILSQETVETIGPPPIPYAWGYNTWDYDAGHMAPFGGVYHDIPAPFHSDLLFGNDPFLLNGPFYGGLDPFVIDISYDADFVTPQTFRTPIADANAEDALALRLAVEKGHTSIVQMLIAAGADVNALDGDPLHTAVLNDDIDMVRLLLDAKADPLGCGGETMQTAVQSAHPDIVVLLAGATTTPTTTRPAPSTVQQP